MKTIKVIVHGRVQGVFFRKYTKEWAQSHDIKGYVKNQSDGTVLIVASGEEENIKQFLEKVKIGSPWSNVTGIEVEEITPEENFASFEIRY